MRDAAVRLPSRVRTLDALHVASALSLGDLLTVLVSYDKRMLEVAMGEGIEVAAPGMDWSGTVAL